MIPRLYIDLPSPMIKSFHQKTEVNLNKNIVQLHINITKIYYTLMISPECTWHMIQLNRLY